jgi:hypothetical protein
MVGSITEGKMNASVQFTDLFFPQNLGAVLPSTIVSWNASRSEGTMRAQVRF